MRGASAPLTPLERMIALRLVSPYERFKIVAKHQDTEMLANGTTRVLAPGFVAEFTPTDVTTFERELARKSFSFRGTVKTMGGDDIDPVTHRVSTFDTNKIGDPKTRAEVEEFFRNHRDLGRDFVIAERPRLAPPWPSYDKEKAADIAKKALDLGFDPEVVIAYEAENKNRASIIDALSPKQEEAEELVTA